MRTTDRRLDDERIAARYGTDRPKWPGRIAVGAVVALYLGVGVWAAVMVARPSIEGNALGWAASERAVTVTLEVRGSSEGPVDCVLRATDISSTDVGYTTVTVPSAPSTTDVLIPTVIRASSVWVLGCAEAGTPMRVPPPDFPPRVAIPGQP